MERRSLGGMSHHKLQESYDHVIVGGGVAADKAARAINERTPDASVLIITRDAEGPVFRPDLTKGLWLDDSTTVEDIALGTADDTGAQLATGTTVTSIDPSSHTVTTDSGDSVGTVAYGTLLLATGASPRRWTALAALTAPTAPAMTAPLYPQPSDYRTLRRRYCWHPRRGGRWRYISRAAVALTPGATVDLYTPDERVLGHMFPASITDHLKRPTPPRATVHHGFRSTTSTPATPAAPRGPGADRRDRVRRCGVIGFGAVLETGLAQDAGSPWRTAGRRRHLLSTSAPDVTPVTSPCSLIRCHRRHVEHVDNAEQSGTVAGEHGRWAESTSKPHSFLFIFDDGYEASAR